MQGMSTATTSGRLAAPDQTCLFRDDLVFVGSPRRVRRCLLSAKGSRRLQQLARASDADRRAMLGGSAGLRRKREGCPGAHSPSLAARASGAASLGGAAEHLPEPRRSNSWFYSEFDPQIWALAIPSLASILLDPLMGSVDAAFVGRLGANELGGVGLSTVLFGLTTFIWNFLLVLTTPAVARAVARHQTSEASEITARGLWVALLCGAGMGGLLLGAAPVIVRAMGAGADVFPHAVTYLRCRAVACPALFCTFVLTGSFRGHQDTRTPLGAAVLSQCINLGLDFLLIVVLGWGVAGAALATAASQYVAVGSLLGRALRKGLLVPAHLARPPPLRTVVPLLTKGLALSVRNITTTSAIILATSMSSQLGAKSLAAHEILRQVFIVSVQAYTALDVTAQSTVAAALGQGDPARARAVLKRILQLGLTAGCILGVALLSLSGRLPLIFTPDPQVIHLAKRVLPIIAAFMPFDALAACLDGGLLGASETAWVSRSTAVVAACVVTALLSFRMRGAQTLLTNWACLKGLSVGRAAMGATRVFLMRSAFSAPPGGAAAGVGRHDTKMEPPTEVS